MGGGATLELTIEKRFGIGESTALCKASESELIMFAGIWSACLR